MQKWNHLFWIVLTTLEVYMAARVYFLLAAIKKSTRPRTSQTPSAIHSAPEKWPGTMGRSFINKSMSATAAPAPAITRARTLFSTKKKDAHVASQPNADAIEPTSVTGTSSESPNSKPMLVKTAITKIAICGV